MQDKTAQEDDVELSDGAYTSKKIYNIGYQEVKLFLTLDKQVSILSTLHFYSVN